MSRDPLEELFGPLEPDDEAPENDESVAEPTSATAPVTAATVVAPTAPVAPSVPASAPVPVSAPMPAAPVSAPVPAFQPFEQTVAPTVPAAAPLGRDELPTAPVPAGRKQPAAFLPWIIVGGVALLALIGALIFILTLNGAADDGDATPETTTEAPPAETEDPAETEESPEASTKPETTTPATSKPPTVDVGNTFPMEISYASISVEASEKLAPNSWYYLGGDTNRVTWESNLMNSFPESCAAMRSPTTQSPWGIEQDATGKWVVVRPEGTCAANPELYNEVWGLMQALADSAKPLDAS